MILHLCKQAREQDVHALRQRLHAEGLRTTVSPEPERPILAVVDRIPAGLLAELRASDLVEEVIEPVGSWRLVDKSFRHAPSTVRVGNVRIGGGEVVVIAGPCSVEGADLMHEAAACVSRAGAHLLRGGAFKPRTSPYSFQGFGREGLRQLKDAGERTGLPVVSEILDASHLAAFLEFDIDCLQIGARNMQNFSLLKAVAGARRPVLLKRGLSATVAEWLDAAEYLAAGGCQEIVLCERGIRTFETATRNTLDLTIVPLLREWTHLPVLVDPSHAAGIASIIPTLSRASLAAGADGVAVEVHPDPAQARSDGPQALLPGELTHLVAEARVMAAVTGRELHGSPRPTPAGLGVASYAAPGR